MQCNHSRILLLLLKVLWSDGRKSWLRDVHLPKKVEEIVQSQQDYTLHLLDVVEFGQRRSELQLLTGKRRENNEFPVGQNIVSRYCVFIITETIWLEMIISCQIRKLTVLFMIKHIKKK